MLGRTIIALLNVLLCVYIWKSNQMRVAQEIALRSMDESWRETDSDPLKEIHSSILRSWAPIQAADPRGSLSIIIFFLSSLEDMFIDLRGRERNIDWLPLVSALTRDQTCNLGMWPEWELNPQTFGVWDNAPTNLATWSELPLFIKDIFSVLGCQPVN